jgi:hypothetical protein
MSHLLIPFSVLLRRVVSKLTLIVIPLLWIVIVLRSGSDFPFLKPIKIGSGSYVQLYKFFFTVIHSNASFHCFIFLISVKCVKSFSILESILKFSGKRIIYLYIWLKLIQVRIRQNDTDSTGSGKGSGSTTPSYSPGTDTVGTLPGTFLPYKLVYKKVGRPPVRVPFYRTCHDQDRVVSFAAFRCEVPDTGGPGGHDASYPLPAEKGKSCH